MEFFSLDHYLLTCTKTQKKVFRFFVNRYSTEPLTFTIPHIADVVDCCIVTVKTATNKFHKDGMIIKYQENGKFSPNIFAFTDLFKKLLDKKK